MKISIITVVYNGAATIEQTIQSVLSQNYRDIEYIIIDGASKDGTLQIVENYKHRLAKFVSEPDRGIYDAMNKGLKAATGDVIGFLNSDDIYADDTIIRQVADTFIQSDVDACYADLVYVDKDNLNKIIRYWKSCEYRDGLFEKGWMPAHPTFFVRKKVYDQYGGFDLDYRLQSDFDLTMRFLKIHKIKSMYIPKIFVTMRIGGESNRKISNVIKGNLESYRACKKNGVAVGPFFILRKIFSRLPQFYLRP
jgi:glycosyltransferase involved in cell wall biosynthesis